MQDIKLQKLMTAALSGALTVLIVSIIILAAVPPVSRDALTHHLAVPKLWIAHGGIYETPDLLFSYYPMNLDLLYTIPLYFGNDILPKYIHFTFALATAWLIFSYLNPKIGLLYSLTGVLFFLSTPIIVKLSITAYVDLGLIFFSTASLLYLIKWSESEFRPKFLFVAALFCGLALGTKYNGLITLFILSCLTPYLYVKHAGNPTTSGIIDHQLKAFKHGVFFTVIACLVYLPWMAKNYVWTGNPVYPLFNMHFPVNPKNPFLPAPTEKNQIITLKDKSQESSENISHLNSHFLVRKHVYGESWWETAGIPIRIFFQGQDDDPKYFDGKLNPFLLILPLFACFRFNKYSNDLKRAIMMFVVFSLFYLFFVYFQIDMRIRWIAPIVPPLVMLSIIGLFRMKRSGNCSLATKNAKLCTGFFWLIVTLMFLLNTFYIVNLFKLVDPISYLSGGVSRDEYIQRFHPEYSIVKYANQNIPHDSVILCLFLGYRQYYSDRKMKFDYDLFKNVVKKSESPQIAASLLKGAGITHLIVRHDLFNKWSHDSFTQAEKKIIFIFFSMHTETLLLKDGYTLVELKERGER